MQNPQNLQIITQNEQEMQNLGRGLAKSILSGTIFIKGNLGAGKTTLCGGFISALGFSFDGSPTYTYITEYKKDKKAVYHWDLYRFESEKDFLAKGLTETQTEKGIHLVEWPEKISPKLLSRFPSPHFVLQIAIEGETRNITLTEVPHA